MHQTTSFNMRLIILLLLGISGANAAIHSLKYFYTGVSGHINFPEFTVVGLVDEGQFIYFDSNNKTAVPKTEWMKREGADYWNDETQALIGQHQDFKVNIQVVKDRFNQSTSTGVHIFQLMYGCEWDEETAVTEGYYQYGYDGDDFVAFDLKNKRWIAPTPQAFISKNKLDNDRALNEYWSNYLTQECIEWLKKYLDYGKNSLKRTVPPSVSLLQKSPSSPVTCHATGFYPRGVMVFWRRDGEEVFEDVDLGETLPNQDGTFQARSTLSVSAEELETHDYTCVVQHSGDKHHDIILNVADLKKNDPGSGLSPGLIAGIIVIGVVVLLALVGVGVGLLVRKNRTRKPDEPSFSRANTDDDSNASSDAAIKT